MGDMGLVRYSLTVHFQDNGLLHELWQCAPNRVLVKCIARVTGKIWMPSEQSADDYLRAYFTEQKLRKINPVDAIPEDPFKRGPRGIDLQIEAARQADNPVASMRWKRMRETVFERDGYTCQHCGKSNVALHVDHVKPRFLWPELTWDMGNIVTLCKQCHGKKTSADCKRWPTRASKSSKRTMRRKADKLAKAMAA